MVNPAALLTLKKKWEEFSARHPKFVAFLSALKNQGMAETFQSNIKLTAEDVELVRSLAGQGK